LAAKLEAVNGAALLAPSGLLSCESSPSFGEIVRACRLRSGTSADAANNEDDESGLAEFLEHRGKTDGPLALILDGAEHLSPEALERLKALSARSADERERLSIVLSGCLEPRRGQSGSALEAMQKTADVRLRLQRFQDRDVKPYIAHRIKLAGRQGPALFTPSAIDRIIHYSGGNPLSINRICRSTLVLASRQTLETVSAEMVDGVAAASASASASETTAEHSRDSGNATVQALDLELTRPASVHKTDLPDDRSRPAEAVSEETTPASEEVEEKPVFRDETAGDAIRKAEIVALDCIPKPYPLEEFMEEERIGWWSPDRIGIVMRCLWVFLGVTLVVGVTGVYLTQTGRFDAIEFSKRWLALLSGEESTFPQNDPLELGLAERRPSHRVEPSSKMDREYRSETEPDSSGDKARQFPEEQRQSIGKPLQDVGSPVKLGSEARSDEAFDRTGLPTAPRSIPLLDTTIKEAGPEIEPKPVAAINETIDRSQFAVTTDSGVEIDETIKITGSPSGVEPQ
jgi:hypothetical protein